ncbi:MAG TPA: hypothetical protein VH333_10315 [Pseudonocardiaceae bacterium]|jgi:hypothetical protein|nr:hypothetical protein [Pseudonocardiaceae bacterium]
MIDGLAFAITMASLGAAALVLCLAATGRYRWRRIAPTLLIIELAVLVEAVTDLACLFGGSHVAEPATHLAYLATSVVVLPVVAGQASRDDGRWAAVLVGVALLVLAVVVVRLTATGRATGG